MVLAIFIVDRDQDIFDPYIWKAASEDLSQIRDIHSRQHFCRVHTKLRHHIHMQKHGTRRSTLDLVAGLEACPIQEICDEYLLDLRNKLMECAYMLRLVCQM